VNWKSSQSTDKTIQTVTVSVQKVSSFNFHTGLGRLRHRSIASLMTACCIPDRSLQLRRRRTVVHMELVGRCRNRCATVNYYPYWTKYHELKTIAIAWSGKNELFTMAYDQHARDCL